MPKKAARPKLDNPERWSGPESFGISFSALNRFLECPERFYLYTWEGIDEDEGFKLPMSYGSIFHEAEEAYRNGKSPARGAEAYGRKLLAEYPTAKKEIDEAVALVKVQYPIYAKYWQSHPDTKLRTEVFAERGFRVPYKLPSGRVVILRGIIDGGYTELIRRTKRSLFLVQENKTKGKIDEEGITKGVPTDLQSLFYVIAAMSLKGLPPVNGLLYNVIRRPLSERWAIRQKKSETRQQFYKREGDVIAAKPEEYFYRWRVLLTAKDIREFKRTIFNPILERLCTWYDWIASEPKDRFAEPHGLHWLAPFGTYSSLAGGWRGSYFEYLTSGRKRTSKLVRKEWGDGKYAPGERPKETKRRPRPKKKTLAGSS